MWMEVIKLYVNKSMNVTWKTWFDLNIHEKLCIKQHAMDIHGKRIHWLKPDHCNCLNELAINYILSIYE